MWPLKYLEAFFKLAVTGLDVQHCVRQPDTQKNGIAFPQNLLNFDHPPIPLRLIGLGEVTESPNVIALSFPSSGCGTRLPEVPLRVPTCHSRKPLPESPTPIEWDDRTASTPYPVGELKLGEVAAARE